MNPPLSFTPTCPADFIGPAHSTAVWLQRTVASHKASRIPLKLLLHGPPGIGKSALINYALLELGCNKWSTTKHNGTTLRIELMDELASQIHYTNLFSDWRAIWIEEADAIPTVAQTRFLTLMDDLPNCTAVLATSNANQFTPRFQSRFQVLELKPPSFADICNLLQRWPIRPKDIEHIATFACGNVRQALLDAQGALV